MVVGAISEVMDGFGALAVDSCAIMVSEAALRRFPISIDWLGLGFSCLTGNWGFSSFSSLGAVLEVADGPGALSVALSRDPISIDWLGLGIGLGIWSLIGNRGFSSFSSSSFFFSGGSSGAVPTLSGATFLLTIFFFMIFLVVLGAVVEVVDGFGALAVVSGTISVVLTEQVWVSVCGELANAEPVFGEGKVVLEVVLEAVGAVLLVVFEGIVPVTVVALDASFPIFLLSAVDFASMVLKFGGFMVERKIKVIDREEQEGLGFREGESLDMYDLDFDFIKSGGYTRFTF